jgi:hypothetical protein
MFFIVYFSSLNKVNFDVERHLLDLIKIKILLWKKILLYVGIDN